MQKKVLSVILSIIIIVSTFTSFTFTASAASYGTTYTIVSGIGEAEYNKSTTSNKYSPYWQYWSQGASKYRTNSSGGNGPMYWGCHVVAKSKLLVEMGIASSDKSVFNPDMLFEWGKGTYWASNDTSELKSNGTVAVDYAASKGVTISKSSVSLSGKNNSSDCEKIMQKIKDGYYVIVSCSSHEAYIGRDASLKAGEPIILNSWVSSSYKQSMCHTFAGTTSTYFTTMYCYKITSGTPSTDTVSADFVERYATDITDTTVKIAFKCVLTGAMSDKVTYSGVDLYDVNGNDIEIGFSEPEDLSGKYDYFYNTKNPWQITGLTHATTYKFKLWAIINGKIYYSPFESFTTTGSHSYSNACDTTCNVCGYTRSITHSYKTSWSTSSTQHWHECSVCGTKKDLSGHTFSNACDTTCNVCGYTRSITHSYITLWLTDSTQHWHECSVCGVKKDTENHSYDNDYDSTCNICGYMRTLTVGTSGRCGEEVYWSLDCDSGALTICGTGDMYDYDPAGAPWYNNRLAIKTVAIESGVTSIGDRAFEDCYNISSAILSNSITKIGVYSFEECVAVTSITIPDNVISIGEYAFVGILSLNEITIGNGVKRIDSGAFYKCENINKVYYKGTKSNWSAIEIADGNRCLTDAEIIMLHPTYDLNSTLSSAQGCSGKTVTLKLSLDKRILVKSGSLAIELPEGFKIVNGSWLYSGPNKNDNGDSAINILSFTPSNGMGVLVYDSNSYGISGDIFEFTVKIPEKCTYGQYAVSYKLELIDSHDKHYSIGHSSAVINVSKYLAGDFDNNENMTSDDAIYLLYHIFFPNDYPVNQSADVDGNGKINSDDAIYLLYHVFFSSEYPLLQDRSNDEDDYFYCPKIVGAYKVDDRTVRIKFSYYVYCPLGELSRFVYASSSVFGAKIKATGVENLNPNTYYSEIYGTVFDIKFESKLPEEGYICFEETVGSNFDGAIENVLCDYDGTGLYAAFRPIGGSAPVAAVMYTNDYIAVP